MKFYLRPLLAPFIALAILVVSTSSQAETNAAPANANERNWHVYASPLTVLIAGIDGGLEYRIAQAWSLGGTLTYYNWEIGDYRSQYWRAMVRGSYAFRGDAFANSVYVAGAVGLSGVKVTSRSRSWGDLSGEGSAPVVMATVGYQWFLRNGLSFRAGGGLAIVSIQRIKLSDTNGTVRDDYQGTSYGALALDATIGYAF